MLNSLYIKNFRNLEELTIESLGRVNLITGKNNTGKSSVLEAVALWVTKGDLNFILNLFRKRGVDYSPTSTHEVAGTIDYTDINTNALSTLFTNFKIGFQDEDAIIIKDIQNSTELTLRFNSFIKENDTDEHGASITTKTMYFGDVQQLPNPEDYNTGFIIILNENYISIPLNDKTLYGNTRRRFNDIPNYQIVYPNDSSRFNDSLFDKITLTEKEEYVIDALRIIDPKVQRIAFARLNGGRKAVIKLSNDPKVRSLQSMGDGINRILTIILALVNCEEGYLLIDEFENGLHHTVQEQLWRVIFYLAEKLDIQVFATTHSWDCIEAYENVLNDEETKTDGKLIRLEHKNDKIRAVEFRKSQLKSATEFGIEIR